MMKLLDTYSFKITPEMRSQLSGLSKAMKAKLNTKLRIEIAKAIYMSKFQIDPLLMADIEDE